MCKEFPLLVAKLIQFTYEQGYQVSFGDAFRSPIVFGQLGEKVGYGAANSFHKLRLAIDLNLYKDGKWLNKTEDHLPLGKYWKTLNPECTWGGDFKFADGNHYSMGESR